MYVYPVTPEISEINWSDFVLVHSWSGFCTCSKPVTDVVAGCYEKPVMYTQYTRIVQIHRQLLMYATWVFLQ